MSAALEPLGPAALGPQAQQAADGRPMGREQECHLPPQAFALHVQSASSDLFYIHTDCECKTQGVLGWGKGSGVLP